MISTSRLFALLLLASLSTNCASHPDSDPAPTPSYDEASRAIMREVAPLVTGRWVMERVHVQRRTQFMYPQAFPQDTVLRQFATLNLAVAPPSSSRDELHPVVEGTMEYKGVSYPVQFRLQAAPERVMRQQGPAALLLFEYKGPIPLHLTTADEQFLDDISLMGENFSLEVAKDQPIMTWRGLQRHIRQIDFRR